MAGHCPGDAASAEQAHGQVIKSFVAQITNGFIDGDDGPAGTCLMTHAPSASTGKFLLSSS